MKARKKNPNNVRKTRYFKCLKLSSSKNKKKNKIVKPCNREKWFQNTLFCYYFVYFVTRDSLNILLEYIEKKRKKKKQSDDDSSENENEFKHIKSNKLSNE